MGIDISANLDAKNFIRGTDNIVDALEEVSDAALEVQRDGDKAGEKLEKSFAEMAKASRTAADDMRTNMRKGFKETEQHGNEAANEIKDEFKSNLSEVTSSFDGSVESMGDLVQGTLGGLVSNLGPLGAAVGAAGAVGIGLIIAEITRAAEQAEISKQRIREMGLAIIESGETIAGLENVNDQLKLIVTNADDAPKKLKDIEKLLKQYPELSDDVSMVALAYAGNADALDLTIKKLREAGRVQVDYNGSNTEAVDAAAEKNRLLNAEADALQKIQDEAAAAKQIELDYLASGGAEIEAKSKAISNINAAYDEVVYGVQDYINAETGVLDVEAYVNAIRERENALLEYQNLLAESGLTTQQKAALNEMGTEQATAILKGLKDPNVSQDQKNYLKGSLGKAADEASAVVQDKMKVAFQKPIEGKVNLSVNTDAMKDKVMQAFQNQTFTIKVKGVDRNGKAVF